MSRKNDRKRPLFWCLFSPFFVCACVHWAAIGLPLSSGYEIVAIAPLVGLWRLAFRCRQFTPFAPLFECRLECYASKFTTSKCLHLKIALFRSEHWNISSNYRGNNLAEWMNFGLNCCHTHVEHTHVCGVNPAGRRLFIRCGSVNEINRFWPCTFGTGRVAGGASDVVHFSRGAKEAKFSCGQTGVCTDFGSQSTRTPPEFWDSQRVHNKSWPFPPQKLTATYRHTPGHPVDRLLLSASRSIRTGIILLRGFSA